MQHIPSAGAERLVERHVADLRAEIAGLNEAVADLSVRARDTRAEATNLGSDAQDLERAIGRDRLATLDTYAEAGRLFMEALDLDSRANDLSATADALAEELEKVTREARSDDPAVEAALHVLRMREMAEQRGYLAA